MDGKSPRIIMTCNQALKDTLAQRAAAIQQTARSSEIVGMTTARIAEPVMTVSITVNLPLSEAASYIEQMKRFVNAQIITDASSGELLQKQAVSVAAPTIPSVSNSVACQTDRTLLPVRLSTKQQGMIKALVAQKKLTKAQVVALLSKQVGHSQEDKLSRQEASTFIKTLMAM